MFRARIIPVDRISKGASLAFLNFTYRRPWGWLVEGSIPGGYNVTSDGSCTCPDGKYKNPGFCKHAWATVGANAAFLVMHIRSAHTLAELEDVGAAFATVSEAWKKATPEAYLKMAREEFQKRKRELTPKGAYTVPRVLIRDEIMTPHDDAYHFQNY